MSFSGESVSRSAFVFLRGAFHSAGEINRAPCFTTVLVLSVSQNGPRSPPPRSGLLGEVWRIGGAKPGTGSSTGRTGGDSAQLKVGGGRWREAVGLLGKTQEMRK